MVLEYSVTIYYIINGLNFIAVKILLNNGFFYKEVKY